jgi:hypothetical protein
LHSRITNKMSLWAPHTYVHLSVIGPHALGHMVIYALGPPRAWGHLKIYAPRAPHTMDHLMI